LIKTKRGNIFGGDTPLELDSTTNNYKKDESMRTFLFTLKTPHGFDQIQFGLKAGGSNAIYCGFDGLAFDSPHDIYVCDNCSTNMNNSTNVGTSFENTKIDSKVLFDETYNFTVLHLNDIQID
jgi:hypothetical protein